MCEQRSSLPPHGRQGAFYSSICQSFSKLHRFCCAFILTKSAARYDEYCERYNALVAKVEDLQRQREVRISRGDGFNLFIRAFRELDATVAEFDDRLWQTLLDTVTVQRDGKMLFKFNNGMTVEN